MGLYDHHFSTKDEGDLVPCSDMCGIVVDSNSTSLKTGTRVMSIFNQSHLTGQVTEKDMATGLGLPLPGVLTEYRCFPAESLVLVPDYMTDEEASCLPIASVTAWMCISENMVGADPIRPDDVLTIKNGTTVEVTNTDAEGRLILADGRAYADE